MNKKIILSLTIIVAALFCLTGCGNKDMWDTNYTFDRAICKIGGEYEEIKIRQWSDYDGEQIQIIATDGKIYLVSTNNCTLIRD